MSEKDSSIAENNVIDILMINNKGFVWNANGKVIFIYEFKKAKIEILRLIRLFALNVTHISSK